MRTYLDSFSQGSIGTNVSFPSRQEFLSAMISDPSLGATIAQKVTNVTFPRWHATGPDVPLYYRVTTSNPTSDPTAITLTPTAWLTQRFTKTLCYEQFGAVGDGETSDHVAMGNLETVLNSAPGHTLVITRPHRRTQTYVNGLSILRSNTTVLGSGNAQIIMDNLDGNGEAQGSGEFNGHGVFVDVSLDHIAIYNLTVSWRIKPSVRGAGDGFRILGYPSYTGESITANGTTKVWRATRYVKLIGCRAEKTAQAGAIFMGVSDIDVRNFSADNCLADQLHFNGCRRIHVDGVQITDSGDDGVALVNYTSANGTIWTYGNVGQPPYTTVGLTDWCNAESHIKNISVYRTVGGLGNGVRVAGCKNVTIDNVYCHGRKAAIDIGSAIKTSFEVPNCVVTSGSAVITVSSATGIVVGMPVRGTGIPSNTTVTVVDGTTVTLSANATSSGTRSLSFGATTNAWNTPASRGIVVGKVVASGGSNGMLALAEGTLTQAQLDAQGLDADLSDFTDFDVTVADLYAENVSADTLLMSKLKGFRFGRVIGKYDTSPGLLGLRILECKDIQISEAEMKRGWVSIFTQTMTDDDLYNPLNLSNIQIGKLVSEASTGNYAVEIQRQNGVDVDKLIIKNPKNSGIFLFSMANLNIQNLEITNPNLENAAGRYGIYHALVRNSYIRYKMVRGSQALTVLEAGGGTTSTRRSRNFVLIGDDYNTKNQTTHDCVAQTGSAAPTDCYIAKRTYNGGEASPTFRAWGAMIGDCTLAFEPIRVRVSLTFDPPAITGSNSTTTTLTVPGAVIGDIVEATYSLNTQEVELYAWVSAANTVTVRFRGTGVDRDLGSGSIRVILEKVGNGLAASY